MSVFLLANKIHLLAKYLWQLVIIIIILADTDECEGDSVCDASAECINTMGSYECQCGTGYTGNGFTCEGKWLSYSNIYNNKIVTATFVLQHLVVEGGEEKNRSNSQSTVAIICTVIATLVVLAIVITVAVFIIRKKRTFKSKGIDGICKSVNNYISHKIIMGIIICRQCSVQSKHWSDTYTRS